jgi:hypothetical protein
VAETIGGREGAQDEIIPLARARLLDDRQLYAWLFQSGQLVEERSCTLLVPTWFDRDVLRRLVVAEKTDGERCPIWDVELQFEDDARSNGGLRRCSATFRFVVHPAWIVETRRALVANDADQFEARLRDLESALTAVRSDAGSARGPDDRIAMERRKDRLKRERKALIDERTTAIDREVRRAVRSLVQRRLDETVDWLLDHGCQRASRAVAFGPDGVTSKRLPSAPTHG